MVGKTTPYKTKHASSKLDKIRLAEYLAKVTAAVGDFTAPNRAKQTLSGTFASKRLTVFAGGPTMADGSVTNTRVSEQTYNGVRTHRLAVGCCRTKSPLQSQAKPVSAGSPPRAVSAGSCAKLVKCLCWLALLCFCVITGCPFPGILRRCSG